MTTRRNLVLGSAGALLSAASPATALLPTVSGRCAASGTNHADQRHRDLLGARFGVHGGSGRLLSARLDRIEHEQRPYAPVEHFTLTFVAPARPALSAGIYGVSRTELGLFSLYLEVSPGVGATQVLQASIGLLRSEPHRSADLDPLLQALRGHA